MKDKVYNEVIEVLKYIKKEDYEKIPKEVIYNFEKNMDRNFFLKLELENLNISRKASSILISLFLKYVANEKEATLINEILVLNQKKNN